MVVVREMMKNGILRVMRGGMRGRLWDTRRIEKVSQINFNFQQYSYYTIQNLNLNEYHEITENTLNNILDKCNVIEESIEDVDITYAQGVLTLNLGSKGIWVINKQTPNRQIWWSSPLSGPLRFEYAEHENSYGWYVTRENKDGSRTELHHLLSNEMKKILGKEINLK